MAKIKPIPPPIVLPPAAHHRQQELYRYSARWTEAVAEVRRTPKDRAQALKTEQRLLEELVSRILHLTKLDAESVSADCTESHCEDSRRYPLQRPPHTEICAKCSASAVPGIIEGQIGRHRGHVSIRRVDCRQPMVLKSSPHSLGGPWDACLVEGRSSDNHQGRARGRHHAHGWPEPLRQGQTEARSQRGSDDLGPPRTLAESQAEAG